MFSPRTSRLSATAASLPNEAYFRAQKSVRSSLCRHRLELWHLKRSNPAESVLGKDFQPQRWNGDRPRWPMQSPPQGSELHHRSADDIVTPHKIEIFVDLIEPDRFD